MRICPFILLISTGLLGADRVPMTSNFQDSASYRWLNKQVLDRRVLDDMTDLSQWTAFTNDPAAVVDSRVPFKVSRSKNVVADMLLTKEQSREGRNSLRLRTPTKLDKPGPVNGRGWGDSGITRNFAGEDWNKFNRLSLWIYPDCPGTYVTSLGMQLHNDGVEKLPAAFAQEGETNIVLRNHEWNHVVWEIGNVARDKITALEIAYYMSGNEPEASDMATYYFDHLELERVDPDYIEGWNVWPGRIAYSHAGYQTGSSKSAIANGLNGRDFRLINQDTGQSVLTKPVETVKSDLGVFQVMDFSEIDQPGTYTLDVAGVKTRPFRIGDDVWRDTILKALNFLYVERCGFAVPGVHGVCHRDWQVVHGDKRIVINGGWHDAGDLTQGIGNTGEIVYNLFNLAERLHARQEDPELYDRVVEEARWGLEWILKTSFHDGYRDGGSVNSRRTNGILGDFDDITVTARNEPFINFLASADEAIAYQVLKDNDPRLANYSLRMAEEDWRFAVAGMSNGPAKPADRFHVSFDSDGVEHEVASQGALASIALWRATGEPRYADKAAELARIIVESQERVRPNWTTPLFGFFYTSPAKDRILHYVHRGREDAPIMALTELCNALPNHPEWMKWYSAVMLHSEYLKSLAKYTEPYGVLPASIYKDDEYKDVPETRRESFRKQVLQGIPLGSGYYLRRLPVWMDYRGHFGTILPQTLALGREAELRGDLGSAQLAQQQIEWIIGRNPFSQSAMWGEGHDFAPQYTPSSGDIVGSLPVGIQSRGESDVPYWPVQNTWTYKEVWVHPVGSWIGVMRDLSGPALVEGYADAEITVQETTHGQPIHIKPDPATGFFRTWFGAGKYKVCNNGVEETLTFLSGATYNVELRRGQALDFEVSKEASPGELTIRVTARGAGAHVFNIRTDNLNIIGVEKHLALKLDQPGTLEWHCQIASSTTPWVAVIIPDNNLAARKEIWGASWER